MICYLSLLQSFPVAARSRAVENLPLTLRGFLELSYLSAGHCCGQFSGSFLGAGVSKHVPEVGKVAVLPSRSPSSTSIPFSSLLSSVLFSLVRNFIFIIIIIILCTSPMT